MPLNKLIFLVILGLIPRQAFSITCQSIFASYRTPPGFNQAKYDEAMTFIDQMMSGIEVRSNPNSTTTVREKNHLFALVIAADINMGNIGSIHNYSRYIPERMRDTFEKMARLFAISRSGDVSGIINFLEGLLRDKKFDQWFEFISHIHQALQKVIPDHTSPFDFKHSQQILDFYSQIGIKVSDPQDSTYPAYESPLPWISPISLTRHFKKRTQTDGFQMTKESELVNAANKFILSSRDGQTLFSRADGTYAKFDSNTKELAIISSTHEIITYFILNRHNSHPDNLAGYMAHVFTDPPQRNYNN